jgi:NADH:ubiquinone oxidoreductase subunit E
MSKVKVKICTGTTCYLMGATHLLCLEERLEAYLVEQVEISGGHCLGCCHDDALGRPPFVMVNDTVVADATQERIREQILRCLKGGA